MKKSVLFGALSLLVLAASCSKMASDEKRLVDAMTGDDIQQSNTAYDELTKWLMTDLETMTYDFPYMREKLTDMHIVASKDSILRCYSWETGRTDTTSSYANIVQWKLGDKMGGFNGSLEKLIANRIVDINIPFTLAHRIDTIIQIDGTTPTIYLIVQSYTAAANKRLSYITAVTIKDMHPAFLPHFFDGLDNVGNGLYNEGDKAKGEDIFKWDGGSGKLTVAVPDDKGNIDPARYDTYIMSKNRFKKVSEDK